MMEIPTITVLKSGLRLKEWDKCREDLKTARDKGVDIVAAFRIELQMHQGLRGEKWCKTHPDNIGDMLTNG